MRQNPVGEPAATAALNFGTPRRRSSWKRLGPFCHCRQRSNVAFGAPCLQVGEHPGGLTEAKVSAPSDEVWREVFENQLCQAASPCPAGYAPDLRLEFLEGLWRDAPLAPRILDDLTLKILVERGIPQMKRRCPR
jgi:hypothetical protein